MPKDPQLIKYIKTDADHHPMGPSGADRWMTCPASVSASMGITDAGSDAAREGTLAHDYAERALRDKVDVKTLDGISSEMAHYVQRYVDYVIEVAGSNKVYIEQNLTLDPYIPYGKGTADAITIDSEGEALHVIDLKYGKGVEVSAYKNRQGLIYALGALLRVQEHYKISTVTIHIAQPRLNNFSTYTASIAEMEEFGEKVKVASDRCLDIEPKYNPDEKACMWCKANSTCTALYEHTMAVVGQDFDPLPVTKMTDEQMKLVIDNKHLIERWLKAVESHVFDRLQKGDKFQGYKVVEGRSTRRWNDKAESVLGEILGDDAFVRKLQNITEIEKILGKKHFAELSLTSKPQGKPVVVSEDDKRNSLSVLDGFDKLD